jgi:hypothetical protein
MSPNDTSPKKSPNKNPTCRIQNRICQSMNQKSDSNTIVRSQSTASIGQANYSPMESAQLEGPWPSRWDAL